MLNWLMTATPDGATRGQVLVMSTLVLLILPWFASALAWLVREWNQADDSVKLK